MKDLVTLGHGSGGSLTHDLIRSVFTKALTNPILDKLDDAGVLPQPTGKIALTTDSFVVNPIQFNGGDIGCMAVYGTINDLAVSGARPQYLTLGAILEEGLPLDLLEQVVASLARAAKETGVSVVTGDTKVVEKGKGDQVFFNTAGVGTLRPNYPRTDRTYQPGDAVIVSGTLGDHGAVILASRSGVKLSTDLKSDCGSVIGLVDALFDNGAVPLFMRDPTRGGLAGVLCDIATQTNLGLLINEPDVPIKDDVQTVCDIVGVDVLHLACEGRVVAIVAKEDEPAALAAWKNLPEGQDACCIGYLQADSPGKVIMKTQYGGKRIIARPTAELLPRIC